MTERLTVYAILNWLFLFILLAAVNVSAAGIKCSQPVSSFKRLQLELQAKGYSLAVSQQIAVLNPELAKAILVHKEGFPVKIYRGLQVHPDDFIDRGVGGGAQTDSSKLFWFAPSLKTALGYAAGDKKDGIGTVVEAEVPAYMVEPDENHRYYFSGQNPGWMAPSKYRRFLSDETSLEVRETMKLVNAKVSRKKIENNLAPFIRRIGVVHHLKNDDGYQYVVYWTEASNKTKISVEEYAYFFPRGE